MDLGLDARLDALPVGVHVHAVGGFELLLVKQAWGELAISRQGAQVLHFRPAGARPVLWLSRMLKAPSAAIRGGVPLCWPWFAAHPRDPSLPAHGVARTADWRWTLESCSHGGLRILLQPATPLWPGLAPTLRVGVDAGALTIELETLNQGSEPVELFGALHTYLAVGDVARCRLIGLEGCRYRDKLKGGESGRQAGELVPRAALDRIYCHEAVTEVLDPVWQRRLRVAKGGSGSTVIWNPGETAAAMADVGAGQQTDFVCVEAANTELDPVRLEPGAWHRLSTTITVTEWPDG